MIDSGLVIGLVVIIVLQIISNNDVNSRLDKDFPDRNMDEYHSVNYVLYIGLIAGIVAIIRSILN